MPRARLISGNRLRSGVSLADFLTARPTGLIESEAWAILCQSVQALQDLFLSGKSKHFLFNRLSFLEIYSAGIKQYT